MTSPTLSVLTAPGCEPDVITGRFESGFDGRPDMTNSRRETATLIIGALMLFGAAATVAEAQERAHERASVSVSEPAPAQSAARPGL